MFNKKYIEHLEEEIEYFKEQIKELNDRLFKKVDIAHEPLTEPVCFIDEETGRIEKMEG